MEHGALAEENATLRHRIATLCAAILRISASLDVRTVLQEVVDSACALSSARYGLIATIDDAGRAIDLVTCGLAPEQHDQLADWHDGRRLFDHLQSLPGPLRLDDLPAYVRALGFATDLIPARTLLAMPLRQQGAPIGSFYLGGKQGAPAFTAEDEEVLVLFGAQVAAAVANARAHRSEQRARADLEALIETSPVGVVVFDARTGKPVSFNREAGRIVAALRNPGDAAEDLLSEITCRRSDGRETSLDEFPLALSLTTAETLRAEEIVLSVPDGRSVAMLVNSTPIHAEDGAVVSLVVTMQDLAPLEEIERQRAGFFGLVSHELRTPLSAIKGAAAAVLEPGAHLDPVEMRAYFRIVDDQADHMRGLVADLLDAGRIDTGTLSVSTEPTVVAGLVERAREAFVAAGGRHTVHIDLPAAMPPVAADGERVIQVLNNLLANAARHAPAFSRIRVDATRDGPMVSIAVTDSGEGVPADRLPHLFSGRMVPGVPREHGSGFGLAICKGIVEAHGGRIRAESAGQGKGTRITFTLPVAETEVAASAGPAADTGSQPAARRERVLVVDDDPSALRFARTALAAAGYAAVATADPGEVPRLLRTERPRLVLLDLLLPNTDGIELMARLPGLAGVPVIFVSAYGRDETIARALEAGAADYIVKPYSPTELVARIKAALRRTVEPEGFRLGALEVRFDERLATLDGKPLRLTAREYDLLSALAACAGHVATYADLHRQVWGTRDGAGNQVVRAFVKKLRDKLGDDPADPVYILNERGIGYRMPSRMRR
ncbi:MAG: response regulator [Gammaproteobacteria bacterium]|nr:response regulator [Gammaproteobacteria bacterium]